MASLCVKCGSSSGRIDAYAAAARALVQAMVESGIRLVYGGTGVGIMGAVADEVLRLGGKSVGVIPEALMRKELLTTVVKLPLMRFGTDFSPSRQALRVA